MRTLVQRVSSANVSVAGEVVGRIGRGLLVLLGVGKGDTEKDRAYVLGKVLGLRIFPNDAGKMDLSVRDVGGALLVVSQFTLYGSVDRGRRPSFEGAMVPDEAERMVSLFVAEARTQLPTETGRFGADMQVSLVNDGPVTFWLQVRS